MKNIIKNGLLTLAAGMLLASCADYGQSYLWSLCSPEAPNAVNYDHYAPIKSYVDQAKYPNLRVGATVSVVDFNEQTLAHAAAVTNFDEISFGKSMMSGAIVTESGSMDFLAVRDLLDHVEELGANVFGSPIVANEGQADAWLKNLTAPIEIIVPFITDAESDFTEATSFNGTVVKGSAKLKQYEGMQVLEIAKNSQINLIEGFTVDPSVEYITTIVAKVDKDVSLTATFSGNRLYESDGKTLKKFVFKGGEWTVMEIKAKPAEGVTEGCLFLDGKYSSVINVSSVKVGHYPDNHRPQTAQELNDTLTYALNAWCDGLMKVNKGRIAAFDLIDGAIDENNEVDGHYELKHSTDLKKNVYWQDGFGSENYGPVVANAARAAFQEYDGNLADLKLFVSESNLDNPKKLESLIYWMGVWDNKGAKIDGISAKLNISYYEDPAEQRVKQAAIETMFKNLAATGKVIRLTDFDINYVNASGKAVSAESLSEAQRANLAAYYSFIIKSYLNNVPAAQQYSITKGNLVDTSAPVGLWAIDTESKDWVRTSSYAAFCDALSGN